MASTGDAATWRLGRRPALDGLRGIAVLLVLAGHTFAPVIGTLAGAVGVTVFFTLSGFLITTLLLEETTRRGSISLSAFYRRRALRLLPALTAVLVVTAALGSVLGGGFVTARQLVAAVFYGENWLIASTGAQGAIAHTWSLSVEEQFYVVWPLLVILLRGRRRLLLLVTSVGIVASMVTRLCLWDGSDAAAARVSFGSDTRADVILVGCLLAVAMHGRLEQRPLPQLAAAGVAGCVLVAMTSQRFLLGIGFTVVALLTALVIWATVQGTRATWLESPLLGWFGRRSYGLYLWHYMVAFTVWHLVGEGAAWWIQVTLIVPPSLLLAVVSWRFIESPFLRISHAPGHAADAPAAPDRVRRSVCVEADAV